MEQDELLQTYPQPFAHCVHYYALCVGGGGSGYISGTHYLRETVQISFNSVGKFIFRHNLESLKVFYPVNTKTFLERSN